MSVFHGPPPGSIKKPLIPLHQHIYDSSKWTGQRPDMGHWIVSDPDIDIGRGNISVGGGGAGGIGTSKIRSVPQDDPDFYVKQMEKIADLQRAIAYQKQQQDCGVPSMPAHIWNPIVISHRGNTHGPNLAFENSPKRFDFFIENKQFYIELDLWRIEDKWFLGHDKPEYEYNIFGDSTQLDWQKCWFHCKNFAALQELSTVTNRTNFFWHQYDFFTITNKGYIWTYPGNEVSNRSITVLIEEPTMQNVKELMDKHVYGICTDYPIKLKEIIENISQSVKIV